MADEYIKKINKGEILFIEGEKSDDLYYLHMGELDVFVGMDKKITRVAQIPAGNFVGEMSFFDLVKRSATVIAKKECVLLKIPHSSKDRFFVDWLFTLGRQLTKSLRQLDHVIAIKGLRKPQADLPKLTPAEEGEILKIIKTQANQ